MNILRIFKKNELGEERSLSKILNDKFNKIKEFIYTNRIYISSFLLILSGMLFPKNVLFTVISIAIIFICFKIDEYIDFKMNKETLELIDLSLLANSTEEKKSLDEILNDFIDTEFNKIIILRGIANNTYINSALENDLLQELVNNVAINISPKIREILQLYYRDNKIENIISHKCFITSTLFTASHNKNIYIK